MLVDRKDLVEPVEDRMMGLVNVQLGDVVSLLGKVYRVIRFEVDFLLSISRGSATPSTAFIVNLTCFPDGLYQGSNLAHEFDAVQVS